MPPSTRYMSKAERHSKHLDANKRYIGMRIEPPSRIKRIHGGASHGGPPVQDIPREGTKLRSLYDVFQANKGIVIAGGFGDRRISRKMEDLRDYYGLDIRRIRNGHWVLAGEWFGLKYVDYIAERLNKN